MCRGAIRDAVPGPPLVRIRTVSNVVSDPTIIRIDEVMTVYRSCGSVMWKNCRTRPAPSMVAASYRVLGMARAAPW